MVLVHVPWCGEEREGRAPALVLKQAHTLLTLVRSGGWGLGKRGQKGQEVLLQCGGRDPGHESLGGCVMLSSWMKWSLEICLRDDDAQGGPRLSAEEAALLLIG